MQKKTEFPNADGGKSDSDLTKSKFTWQRFVADAKNCPTPFPIHSIYVSHKMETKTAEEIAIITMTKHLGFFSALVIDAIQQ